MKQKKWAAGILVTVFTAGLAGITTSQAKSSRRRPVLAQPVDGAARIRLEERYNEQYAGGWRLWLVDTEKRSSWPNREAWENMTPQEREQAMRKFMEDRLRESLTRAGFPQEDLQDNVVELSRTVEADRRSIREKGGKFRAAMADGSSDAQVGAFLADFRKSVAVFENHRDRGRGKLNRKIGFSKKPRLDALLSLLELGGDESFYLMNSFGVRSFGRRSFGNSPGGPSHGDWENLTPEQRDQARRKFMEDRLRDGLARAGFTQDDLQDDVVDFSRAVEADRRSIRDKGGKLRAAMADGSSEGQVGALLADLRRTVSAAKIHRDKGRRDLNDKIGFSKRPRLDALLALSGLGGDESFFLMTSFGGRNFGHRDFGSAPGQRRQ
jgi:hypothetical protein